MYSLFLKGNSEFNTDNTEIKLGEQGKKQYVTSPSLRGFWHSCVCDLMPCWVVLSATAGSALHPSPLPDTSRAPAGTCRGLTPRVLQGSWKAFRSSSAAHSIPHYQASFFFFLIELQFSPLEIHPLGPHAKMGDVWGQI